MFICIDIYICLNVYICIYIFIYMQVTRDPMCGRCVVMMPGQAQGAAVAPVQVITRLECLL